MLHVIKYFLTKIMIYSYLILDKSLQEFATAYLNIGVASVSS